MIWQMHAFIFEKKNNPSLINIGTDIEYSIKSFAEKIMKILNIKANIKFHKTNIKWLIEKIRYQTCKKIRMEI